MGKGLWKQFRKNNKDKILKAQQDLQRQENSDRFDERRDFSKEEDIRGWQE